MSLFRWLASANRIRRCSDTYSLKQVSKWTGIADAIDRQCRNDRATVVVSHFADSFFAIQTVLNDRSIDYAILDRPLTPVQMVQWFDEASPGLLILALAEMLVSDDSDEPPRMIDTHTSVIFTERHPMRAQDIRLERFAAQLPGRIRYGHFVSLEDAFVRESIGEWTPLLMQQLGMNDYELVTSHLVSRRLENAQRKLARRVTTNHPADSAEEWLRLNDPQYGK